MAIKTVKHAVVKDCPNGYTLIGKYKGSSSSGGQSLSDLKSLGESRQLTRGQKFLLEVDGPEAAGLSSGEPTLLPVGPDSPQIKCGDYVTVLDEDFVVRNFPSIGEVKAVRIVTENVDGWLLNTEIDVVSGDVGEDEFAGEDPFSHMDDDEDMDVGEPTLPMSDDLDDEDL